ncbi:acyl-CoA synthetase (AMP-forming)/AMP-acid ligase II [Volucribacter psittacicida]|uniref:Acyl-CoA synthetase (AMP-forming)/AMP-acid ligase II n=1 Tax=Volucribacter psittacicida TaxID=203482 RepID=A0A4R1G1M2_9PAST|nr:class I adenylate-forming enzyme family protein [Volucribacter psittacicida]TCK01534.1 acyl-CoA synthetase (AMP-forming)/AMP-acid ligase II [Volucribacter psittacicida]
MKNKAFYDYPDDKIIALNPTWTWQQFRYRSWQIYHQLKQDNIQSVALMLENYAFQTCVMLACFNANVTILLPPHLLDDNVEWIEQNAQLLLTDDNINNYAIEQSGESELTLINKYSKSQIWQKTSGSTGKPKISVINAEKMWKEVDSIYNVLNLKQESPLHLVASVSAQHRYGLTFCTLLPLRMGWTFSHSQQHYPEFMIEESLKASSSIWITSPTLLNNLNLSNQQLLNCGLHTIISAGGALSPNVAKHIESILNCKIIEFYGSTETGIIAFKHTTSNWLTAPLVQIGITEKGTLWVESPWQNQREETADAIEFYNNQQFNLLGRIDRIVKFGDKRISLVHIEQNLLSHPWVKDCYIAQHPIHFRPAAWVALSTQAQQILTKSGKKHVQKTLRQHLEKSQENIAIPRYWRFTHQLPRNSQAKISRQVFEQVFLSETQDKHYE